LNSALLGIDRAIGLTLINRGWGILSGPISLLFIVGHLNPVEQGFYFTMGSLLGLQVLFELGLNFVVLQTISHMMPRIRLEQGQVIGDPEDIAHLGCFVRDLLRWYMVVAGLFVLCLSLGGAAFLSRSIGAEGIAWQIAWYLALAGFGANIICNAVFSVIEGMGKVADVAAGRLLQSVGSVAVLWALLLADERLVALGGLHIASFILGATWLTWRHGRLLLGLYQKGKFGSPVDWRTDIWPFQWRIALSWLAGYLGSQSIVPIAFNQLGPVAAGQIGLSATVMSATSVAALAWVTTKSPTFGRLVSEHSFGELNALFRHAYRTSRAVAAGLAATLVAGVLVIDQLWPEYASRVLSPGAFVLLAVAMVFNVQVSAQAIYLRAFRREPFLAISVTSGLALAFSALLLSRSGDLSIILGGYTAITATISIFWATPLFNRIRKSYTHV
jgi:hypothetical protein